ncbi:MAG: bifunctional homocysteine S-methyltransferase/methylenetetrahydrofolate reductase [Sulfobacillus sp.]|nr:bifunctional homocysteine S-methyltransferase/methylenetetrahydrofolate reductase [Sulfobacillus sp.]
MKPLAEALSHGLWLADGAIGTWFLSQGVEPHQLPLLPLDHPDLVIRCHLEYLQAGAQIIETHSFSANRSKLAAMGWDGSVGELNRRAAQLARHARDIFGEPAYVLGSLGPLAVPVDSPIVPGLDRAEAETVYREAVAGLLAGGVDGFLVETMSDLATVEAAVSAIRAESDLPIVVSFAFSPLGTTLYGITPEAAVEAVMTLPGGPPAAIGANCGSGPSPLLDAVIRMAEKARTYQLPVVAYPNAGEPALREGHVHYPASPDYMATIAPALKAAGCAVIGGCCGTTPSHIRAIRQNMQGDLHPQLTTRPGFSLTEDVLPKSPDPEWSGPPRLVHELLAQQFVLSVELDPPRGPNLTRLVDAARQLEEEQVDVINVADSPMARVRLGALATARLIQERTRLATILHFTTRDRNLMGLQSDLLGAFALGLTNILCLTGDPPGLGDYAHATAVYDLDSIGLTKVLAGFNQGLDALGQPLGSPTVFSIGVGVNPTADPLEKEIERFRQKVAAGAHYAMSQPIYAPEQFYRFLDALGGPLPIPLILGIMPLVSYRQALYLHNEVPGITIPPEVLSRFESVQDGVHVGIELALELIQALRAAIHGIYLVPSFNRVEPLVPLIREIRGLTR